MTNTKDIVFNVNYVGTLDKLNRKKRGIKSKILDVLTENKFIFITLISVFLLVVIDLVLVNTFMNLIFEL